MPHSEVHKRKFKKNLAVLGLIIGFIALIWSVTMIKIAANKPAETPSTEVAAPVE